MHYEHHMHGEGKPVEQGLLLELESDSESVLNVDN